MENRLENIHVQTLAMKSETWLDNELASPQIRNV
jgi:hypothetical protein